MKSLKISKKKWIPFLALTLLFSGTVLTGCSGREEEFLAEIRDTDLSGETKEKAEEEPKERNEKKKETVQDARGKKDAAGNDGGQEEKEIPSEPAEIYVDVCGAVASPGVFRLEEGSRVFQAIEAAGGYLPEAAQEYLNRAGVLTDGQQVYVPTKEETAGVALPGEVQGGAVQAEASGGKVNINTAGAEELTSLTGIGETRAKAIIAYREANGPFAVAEDIMNVQGIKEGTFEKIKDEIIAG